MRDQTTRGLQQSVIYLPGVLVLATKVIIGHDVDDDSAHTDDVLVDGRTILLDDNS
jgi:hypothetical protein